ncbi:hypothetical protein [Bradyrhizobium sp.]|uniref:hypothetical protein n=1 Tax=Bradyrhizobium sp. TaxID=376 RepID=UPI002619CAB1|nr:hypothetical protein [Bradyrhizobium sp.]
MEGIDRGQSRFGGSRQAAGETGEQLHGRDYLVYAYLQLAQDEKAQHVIDAIEAVTPDPDSFGGAFSRAAAPARYVVERGDWRGAARLDVVQNKFPQVMAISHFARALGAARSGDVAAARADLAKLVEIRDRLREAKNDYWATQADIEQQITDAWMLRRRQADTTMR